MIYTDVFVDFAKYQMRNNYTQIPRIIDELLFLI